MSDIVLTYRLSEEHLSEFYKIIAIRHPFFVRDRRKQLVNRATPVLSIALCIATLSHAPLAAALLVAFGGLWCWYSYATYPERFARNQAALVKQVHLEDGTGERVVAISSDSISYAKPLEAKSELPWSIISYWGIGKKIILVGYGPAKGVVIPLSSLSDDSRHSLCAKFTAKLGAPAFEHV